MPGANALDPTPLWGVLRLGLDGIEEATGERIRVVKDRKSVFMSSHGGAFSSSE